MTSISSSLCRTQSAFAQQEILKNILSYAKNVRHSTGFTHRVPHVTVIIRREFYSVKGRIAQKNEETELSKKGRLSMSAARRHRLLRALWFVPLSLIRTMTCGGHNDYMKCQV